MQSALRERALEGSVRLLGAVGEEEIWALLAGTDLLVLPSVTESFGVAVAEALTSGTPVIATKGTPWRELEEAQCGWWVDASDDAFANAIRDATSLSDSERVRMGRSGQELIAERYAPRKLMRDMISVYHWLIHGGFKPACVDLVQSAASSHAR